MPVTKVDRVANPSALIAAALAAGAGLLHIAVTRTHLAESTVDGVLMLVAAWVQLGFAVALLVAPSRLVRLAGASALLVIGAAWAAARITGLPFGHSQGAPEDVRLLGTVATALGVLAALVALAGARPSTNPTAPTSPPSARALAATGSGLAAVLTLAIVASPTGHGGGSHGTGGHGGSARGTSGTGGHQQQTSGTAGDPAAGSGTTGSTGAPAAATPSPAQDSGDGHQHAPGEGH